MGMSFSLFWRKRTPAISLFLISALLAVVSCQAPSSAESPKPPVAQKIPKELIAHGETRIDNYYWLNERDNPRVLEYLKAENEYLRAVLKHTEPLQGKLYDEIVGRIKQTDMSVPYKLSGYYYYTRYEQGQEYPLYCRKKGNLQAQEEVLLNVPEMARGHSFYHVTGLEVSLYNNILAYGVDTVSRRKYTIYFKNLTTGENFPESLPNTTGQAAWANDNKTVFYTVKDESLRPFKIFRHVLGSDVAQDKEIYHEKDETFECNVSRTKSRMYLMIASDSTTSNEYRFLDAGQPEGEFKVIQPRERNLEYSVDHYRNRWFILTNWKAKNFRLISTPLNQGLKENWRDVIPHRDDVLLENFELFNNYLVVDERKDGLTRLRIFHGPKNTEHYIEFGEKAYTAYIALNPEFDTQWLRFGYSSLTTPRTIFDYHMYTHEKILLKREEVLGGFNPELYQTERLFATAPDGVKIPISLVWRKDRLEKNGGKPLLLYGYGSYGYSSEPAFSSALLSLLDRGFIYAIAHIRGGQEMGRDWYENGKLLKKKNTFSDFIACAEHLVAEKYSRPDRLFAMGGSAGGLLMGAVVNMRPELFRGVIAGVPWVDVVTTMLDSSIPLTTSEYDEWGNPADKQFYDYMLSYSPYDNVTARNYPALLVTTGLHDSQVQYWEPAKWVAKLRDLKTDKNILVLYTNMEAGHGGASGRFQRYKETALEHAFLLDLVGIKE